MRLYKSADTKIAARRISRGKIDIKYHPSQTDKNDGAGFVLYLFFSL